MDETIVWKESVNTSENTFEIFDSWREIRNGEEV
eukprot:CAMPEP_0198216970 /NCGR_PEP_ID=MMETSP1445-20131203/60839_1 /TAXON_ID=36898 /ORGANISM="Pyramimonas sp., Strain CCMP2087" /LENGTH=33 /DNA_ID= /DNA_START= /DNA_END= /DNA_ORIENTATION=